MKEDTPLQDSNTWPFEDGDMLTSIDNPYNPKEENIIGFAIINIKEKNLLIENTSKMIDYKNKRV